MTALPAASAEPALRPEVPSQPAVLRSLHADPWVDLVARFGREVFCFEIRNNVLCAVFASGAGQGPMVALPTINY